MLQPGRTYNAVTSYRYGFNGKENDNDISGEGNKVDFGDRIYDSRVGRFLSIDPQAFKYPSMSPYTGIGNNPINFTDPDGNLLRDKDGNLIVIRAGKGEVKTKTIYTGAYADGPRKQQPILITYTYQEVYVIANDGHKIKAQLVTSQKFLEDENVNDPNPPVSIDAASSVMLSKSFDAASNCHGATLANGQLNIFSEDIGDELLNESEFKTTTETKATVVIYTEGDKTVTHSAKKEGDTYTFDDGATTIQKGDKNAATVKDKYKNPKYKNEVVKKSDALSTGGDATSRKGLRIFSETDYNTKTQKKPATGATKTPPKTKTAPPPADKKKKPATSG
jgi:RHS repeat-associated protein